MSRKIRHALIFNDLWKGVCEGEGDNQPTKPTSDKDLIIWVNKNNKSNALVVDFVNEEVSCHIIPITISFDALNKLKYLCDSHSELEVV